MKLFAALSILVLLYGCSTDPDTTHTNGERSALTTVAVAQAAVGDLSNSVTLTAEFVPYQEVDVMAKVAGFVRTINVDIGDRVNAGQLLAVLEVPEMREDIVRGKASIARSNDEVARANNELQRAESNHEIAHLSYQRLSAVDKVKPGLVAQQEIDDARSKDLAAEAQIDSAKSALAAAKQSVQVTRAEEGRTEAMFDYTRVTAPFSGVITKRYANTGTMIQAGTSSSTQAMPIIRLSQNTLLRLILPVPESVVPQVRLGESVEVNVPSLHRSLPGKVARVEGKLDLTTRTMNTEVDVENRNLVLIPGMYAEVNLTLAHREHAVTVPVTAIERTDNITSVYQVTANDRVQIVPVVVGISTADLTEVKSGVQEGDLVIVGNRSELKPNQPVRPKLVPTPALKAAH